MTPGERSHWDETARELLRDGRRPHFAPDDAELAAYRGLLASVVPRRDQAAARPRLLVLGATPELADLGLELGYHVLRVDASDAMFEAARLRERLADREHEERIRGDWRNLTFLGEGSVDAVAGDAALNNVPPDAMSAVFAALRRVLKSGGIVALRQVVLPDDVEFDTSPAALARARREGTIGMLTFRMFVRFVAFRDRAYDESTAILDAAEVFLAIEEEEARGTWTPEEYEYLNGTRSRMRHTIYEASDQAARLRRAFGRCREIHASEDPRHRLLFPIFAVTKS